MRISEGGSSKAQQIDMRPDLASDGSPLTVTHEFSTGCPRCGNRVGMTEKGRFDPFGQGAVNGRKRRN
jgi:hypothetical protein